MPKVILQISYSLPNIESAADRFWQLAHQYRVLAFNGEMGAGKTTFIHSLCDYLGVRDAVSSPTFALVNEYSFLNDGMETPIFHMDWYRLKNSEEGIQAGIEDLLVQPFGYCFIEWAERCPELLRDPVLWVDIAVLGPDERELKVYRKD